MNACLYLEDGTPASSDHIWFVMESITAARLQPEPLVSPADASQLVAAWLGNERDEHFGVLFLDARHRIIAREVLFHGTIDGSSVHPRVVIRRALELNASTVILAHNHPSGTTEPSAADLAVTRRIRDALALVDIRILDHLIVSGTRATSLAAQGHI